MKKLKSVTVFAHPENGREYDHERNAKEGLIPGGIYELIALDVGSFHSCISIRLPGGKIVENLNSVCFDFYKTKQIDLIPDLSK